MGRRRKKFNEVACTILGKARSLRKIDQAKFQASEIGSKPPLQAESNARLIKIEIWCEKTRGFGNPGFRYGDHARKHGWEESIG